MAEQRRFSDEREMRALSKKRLQGDLVGELAESERSLVKAKSVERAGAAVPVRRIDSSAWEGAAGCGVTNLE